MEKKKLSVNLYICQRCGHRWLPSLKTHESGDRPTFCGKCKKPNWNRKKREKEGSNGLVQD